MDQAQRRAFLIESLIDEAGLRGRVRVPADESGQRELLRALFNVRPPMPAAPAFLEAQDAYLRRRIEEAGIARVDDLEFSPEGLCVRRGDIVTLACDAVVNAANAGMTGCYHPGHRCIDNCIHTFAGVQLRLACAQAMERRGIEQEPVGRALVTPAFNLPSRFVLHTVGPYVGGSRPTAQQRRQLASCYESCLSAAAQRGLESVALCCVATGEYAFPREDAAATAVEAVRRFMENPGSVKRVVFDVFEKDDEALYRELLR